jgi:hypothetical protein
MEREEYIQELIAAYGAMDDRARDRQMRQFKRAAVEFPRSQEQGLRLVANNSVPLVSLVKRQPTLGSIEHYAQLGLSSASSD